MPPKNLKQSKPARTILYPAGVSIAAAPETKPKSEANVELQDHAVDTNSHDRDTPNTADGHRPLEVKSVDYKVVRVPNGRLEDRSKKRKHSTEDKVYDVYKHVSKFSPELNIRYSIIGQGLENRKVDMWQYMKQYTKFTGESVVAMCAFRDYAAARLTPGSSQWSQVFDGRCRLRRSRPANYDRKRMHPGLGGSNP